MDLLACSLTSSWLMAGHEHPATFLKEYDPFAFALSCLPLAGVLENAANRLSVPCSPPRREDGRNITGQKGQRSRSQRRTEFSNRRRLIFNLTTSRDHKAHIGPYTVATISAADLVIEAEYKAMPSVRVNTTATGGAHTVQKMRLGCRCGSVVRV